MSLNPGTKLGSYEILAPLGAGGMGEVYKAKDTRLDRTVAIKVLPSHLSDNPQLRERFEREARAVSSLNHPHICTLHDIGSENGIDFMVMEHIEGDTLADRLKRGGLPLDQALQYGIEIADALDRAHRQGVVHRDLKPGNIMLTKSGAKLLDFGLAKVSAEPVRDASGLSALPTEAKPLTQEGSILGTFQYMAPEQLEGKEADSRTDIFAFGAVVYEMVTGKKAFEGTSQASLIVAIMEKDPPAISELQPMTPPPLDRVIKKCLSKHPDSRWQSASDLQDGLKWITEGGLTADKVIPAPDFAQKAIPFAMVAVLAAGIAALIVWNLMRSTATTSSDRVLRYSIPLVERGLTLGFELSPDGRHVAFSAAAGNLMQIYRRSLDSMTLQSAPDTAHANGLFWSPDSRYIAFFAYEKMWRVPVGGGPAEQICDVPGLLGARGTWGRRGIIVYAPSSKYEPGPLRSVPESGGESSVLTTSEPGEAHRYPVFLPNGNHFLYTSFGGAEPGIYLASLDEPAGRRLLADQSSVDLTPGAPDGGDLHLLFIRSGALMAQAFDLDQLELLSEPGVLLEDAPRQDDGAAAVSVSEDGTLTYLAGRSREVHSRSSWFDRSGNLLAHETDYGPASFVSLSPDENLTVVPRRLSGAWSTDLYLRDVARGVEERLTYDETIDVASNVVWSPRGESILFSANPVNTFNIYRKEIRSVEPPEPLLETSNPAYVTDWSTDGRLVVYTDLHPVTQADIWYVPVESTHGSDVRAADPVPFLRTQFLESSGQLSPDGNWLAYTSDEAGDVELYVRSFPAGEGKRKISNGWTQEPRWSPDGRELFYFTGPESKMTLMRVEVTRAELASSEGAPIFEFSQPEALFDVRVNGFHPATGTFFYAVSSDGQRFLINHVDNEEEPVLNVVVNWQRAFGLSEER